MRTVFLSYRRSDTGGEAGRLADTFQHRLGGSLAFRDVVDIPPGVEFDSMLDKELTAAKIVLVLIGPAWLAELQQRLEQTDIDYLRVEVATALARGKRVIPVLLKGAALPSAAGPARGLGSLARHQAMTLRDESWDQDVDRLIDAIGRPYRWNIVAIRAVVALLAIVVAVKLLVPLLPDDRANDVVFLRMLVGSLAGVYALVEFAVAYRYFRKLKRDTISCVVIRFPTDRVKPLAIRLNDPEAVAAGRTHRACRLDPSDLRHEYEIPGLAACKANRGIFRSLLEIHPAGDVEHARGEHIGELLARKNVLILRQHVDEVLREDRMLGPAAVQDGTYAPARQHRPRRRISDRLQPHEPCFVGQARLELADRRARHGSRIA